MWELQVLTWLGYLRKGWREDGTGWAELEGRDKVKVNTGTCCVQEL